MQENEPAKLEYESRPPRPTWSALLVRHAPVAFWGVALALYPLLALYFLPGMRRTSGVTDPQIFALQCATPAIAVRAAIALFRRERNWRSLAYIALYFVLPIIAGVAAEWWWCSKS